MSLTLTGRRGRSNRLMGRAYTPVQSDNAEIVELWVLRIFAKTYDSVFATEEDMPGALLRIAVPRLPQERPDVFETLFEAWREAEKLKPGLRGALSRNLTYAGKILGLEKAERMLLAFATLIETHADLDDASDLLGRNLSDPETAAVLDDILGLSKGAAQKALHPEGTLISSGLLQLESTPQRLQQKMQLLQGIGNNLLADHEQPEALFHRYLCPSIDPTLKPEDYAHVGEDYHLLERYLSYAAEQKNQGVNVLLHGSSGTGKTQLARLLAQQLRLRLYEVPNEAQTLSQFDSSDRLRAYRLAQRLLARRPGNAILFDEIEDIFPSTFHGMSNLGKAEKALVNELLETNPVPALWLSNNVWQIDPAAVRRFDYVLELGTPNRKVRQRILEKYLDRLPVRPQWIERIAENDQIAPALMERAAKVVAVLKNEPAPVMVEKALERTLSNTLEAMGLPRISNVVGKEVTRYRLDCLNTDADLAMIASGLERNPHGRFCLYGAPGTGKSAFGQYVGRSLDRPLLVRRASDLLDPYLGMTEKNIARMFEQAEHDEAVLLLDEADGFLRDRLGARQSWEVTQVNELLTRMESFEGVFICSTNLMDSLDQAALRRFDLKIRFGYLAAEQAWTLFEQVLEDNGGRVRDRACWKQRLEGMDRLTPGDYATAVRQFRFSEKPMTPLGLLDALAREVAFKADRQGRGIGFSAQL